MARSGTKTSRISIADQVSRHVKKRSLERDPVTDQVIGIFNSAFYLRPERGETGLSVHHLQHFQGTTRDQLRAVKSEMTNGGFRIDQKSAYAVLAVSVVDEIAKQFGVSLPIYKGNPRKAHCEMIGLSPTNSHIELLERMALEALKNFSIVSTL